MKKLKSFVLVNYSVVVLITVYDYMYHFVSGTFVFVAYNYYNRFV